MLHLLLWLGHKAGLVEEEVRHGLQGCHVEQDLFQWPGPKDGQGGAAWAQPVSPSSQQPALQQPHYSEPYFQTLCCVLLHCAVLCCAVLHSAALCSAVLCHAVLCWLCHAVLCYFQAL